MAEIPYGFCKCGCGEKAPLATRARPERGNVRGEPVNYIRGHRARRGKPPEYIIDPDTGCWVWQRCRTDKGYGLKFDGSSSVPAHRVYYEKYVGPIPEGFEVDHLCHDPTTCVNGPLCPHRACVNPAHLEPVTHAENGRRGASAKLDIEKVREIRDLRETGLSLRAIGLQFGVSAYAIRAVLIGRTWTDVA